jgi:hypothetical protein
MADLFLLDRRLLGRRQIGRRKGLALARQPEFDAADELRQRLVASVSSPSSSGSGSCAAARQAAGARARLPAAASAASGFRYGLGFRLGLGNEEARQGATIGLGEGRLLERLLRQLVELERLAEVAGEERAARGRVGMGVGAAQPRRLRFRLGDLGATGRNAAERGHQRPHRGEGEEGGGSDDGEARGLAQRRLSDRLARELW